MKYIKLYEAFESNTISGVLKYIKRKIGNEQSNNFLHSLRKILKNYDYPIDKISNDNVRYLSAKKALPIKSNSSTDSGIYCLKFWFSLDKGYIGYTGVGDRVMSISRFSSIERSSIVSDTITSDVVDYIENTLNIKTGKMYRVTDYSNLQHGDVVIGLFNSSLDLSLMSKAKIFRDGNRLYAIQDVAYGGSPEYNDHDMDHLGNWRDWGSGSWVLGNVHSPGDDHKYLYKYTEDDTPLYIDDYNRETVEEKENHYLYNLPIDSHGTLMDWSRYKGDNISIYNKNWKDIEDADFCIIIYLDNMLKSEFKKTTKKSEERKELRKGAISLMTEKELRNANIDRYMKKMLTKMGISPEKVDLKNLQKYISSNIIGDYSYFSIYRNKPDLNDTKRFTQRILRLFKMIKDGDSGKVEIEDFYNDRIVKPYIENNLKSSEYKQSYDNVYRKYINAISRIKDEKNRKDFKEYLETCKDIGVYINRYVSSQEINSIDDYIFLCSKIISIRSVMLDDNFKNISVLAKYIGTNSLATEHELSNLIDYINSMSVGQIDEYKEDIKRLRKVKSYVESILK